MLTTSKISKLATLCVPLIMLIVAAPTTQAINNLENKPVSLQEKKCVNDLKTLAKKQAKKLAPQSTINNALNSCENNSLNLPALQFASVEFKNKTVGMVFISVESNGEHILTHYSGGPEGSTVARLLNGNSKTLKKWAVNNAPVIVTLAGNTTETKGEMSASLGEGGAQMTIILDTKMGTTDPALIEIANQTHPSGEKVYVYGDFFGVKETKIGPTFKQKWASIEGTSRGIVTDSQGNIIGISGLFGTGFSNNKDAKFWSNRSYFMKLSEILN